MWSMDWNYSARGGSEAEQKAMFLLLLLLWNEKSGCICAYMDVFIPEDAFLIKKLIC